MISVIIPLYNKEQIIEKSLKSVLSQDYDDFEVVIVNDGSTDRSAEIVKRINDSRIRLIEQENGGPSKARNTGVKNAKGDWIVFLDADDEFLPGALKYFSDNISKYSNESFLAASSFVVNNNAEMFRTSFVWEGKLKNPYASHVLRYYSPRTGNCIHRTSILKECLFNENIRRYEDVDFFFRMYKKCNVFLLPEPVLLENKGFAAASCPRKNIKEDFLGNLNIHNKGFWEVMGLYRLFLEERNNYGQQCRDLNESLYRRFDLFLCYNVLSYILRAKIIRKLLINYFVK